jgi:transposase
MIADFARTLTRLLQSSLRPVTPHKAGAQFFLLPPYSPDMNPIEMALSKLKTLLRQAPERTRDGLWRRIGELLDRFTPDECANYLRAAGYADSI